MNKNSIVRMGFWDDLWNSAENWYDAVTNAVTNWWNNGGKDVVISDVSGATIGAIAGAAAGSWTTIGAIGTAAIGAAGVGLGSSGEEAMNQWLNSIW